MHDDSGCLDVMQPLYMCYIASITNGALSVCPRAETADPDITPVKDGMVPPRSS